MHAPIIRSAIVVLLLCVSPAPLFAQDGGSRGRKVQAFLIPYDGESVQMATSIGGHIERALARTDRLELIDLASVLGGQPPPEFQGARDQARTLLDSGINHFNNVRFGDAVEALNKALEIHRANASWIDRLPEYADAMAYLAASYMMVGQPERGRAAYKELLLFKSDFSVDTDRFDASLQAIVDEVRNDIENGPVGSISVTSNPPGARVFVSGVQRGFTPVSIERIPTGRHFVRLEQMGTMPHGEVIDVTPTEDGNFQMTLRPTEQFERLQAIVSEVGAELGAGRLGPAMIRLGRYVGLDWAVYGVVQRTFGSVQVNLWVVHIPHERRLATRRFELPTTEFNLDREVAGMVAAVIEDAWRREERGGGPAADPLSGRSGTEGWFRGRDERGERRDLDTTEQDGRRGRRGGRQGTDPLDERDGTEGW